MDFNDYLYIDRGSTSGPTQIGEGVSIYAVLGDFSQGAFESTNSGTDVAIDGNGFFGVRQPNSKTMYYTRAGDFYFNKDRELVNPEALKVQGLRVDNTKQITFNTGATIRAQKGESPWVGQGSPTDIVLDSWNCIPQRTTNVTVSNLLINDDFYDKARSDTNPMTALFDLWDAKKEPHMPNGAYATQTTMKVYDESGTEHELTVYFDKIQNPLVEDRNGDGLAEQIYKLDGLPAGYQMYEYLVTIPPEQDLRSYGGTYNPATGKLENATQFYQDPDKGTNKNAGLLMQGVLIFNAAGQLVDQTAYTYGAVGNASVGQTTITLGGTAYNIQSNGDLSKPVVEGTVPTGAITTTYQVTTSGAVPNGKVTITKTDAGTGGSLTTTWTVDGVTDFAGIPVGTSFPAATSTDPATTAKAGSNSPTAPQANSQMSTPPDYKTAWQPTKLSNNNIPVVAANFTAQPLANSVSEMLKDTGDPRSQAQDHIIEIDFGLASTGGMDPWVSTAATNSLADLTVVPGTYHSKFAGTDITSTQMPKTTIGGPLPSAIDFTQAQLTGRYSALLNDGTSTVYVTWFTDWSSGTATPTDIVQKSIPNSAIPGGSPITPANGAATVPPTYYVTMAPNANDFDFYVNGTTYTFTDATGTGNATPPTFNYTGAKIPSASPPRDAGTYAYAYQDPASLNYVTVTWDEDGAGNTSNVKAALFTAGATGWNPPVGGLPPSPILVSDATMETLTQPVIEYAKVAHFQKADRKDYATANNGSTFISDGQQDGYGSGVLNGYNIDTNGVLYGRYSNNVTLPLWQMTLFDFRNLQGLRREGGNLYSQTMDSGNARWSIPGNAGFGSTQAYNIEQSNVDMAREFVQMIVTQRGFQANSKSVTTVDTMLDTVINMKR